MNRPYIICHMVTSIDGKVTGDFLSQPECERAVKLYYEINRSIKSDGFICGRATMESSFTGGWYPDLSQYKPVRHDHGMKMDFMLDDLSGFYAVAFDTNGRLGWRSNKIIDPDGDPGYDGAQIIEVLSEQVDERYLGYLEEMEIPYIFAGETEIDIDFALFKLRNIIGCERLLLEGGSIINGTFLRADAVDELSLVTAPITGGKDDKPLFSESVSKSFTLVGAETKEGCLVLSYKKTDNKTETRSERISRMEQYFDTICQAVKCDPLSVKSDTALQSALRELTVYLESGRWLADYKADEQGELPSDLKRGVLSQDALYNLLCETDLIEKEKYI